MITKNFIFDLETTGLDTRTAKILGVGYTINSSNDITYDENPDKNWVINQVQSTSEVVGHNLKYDLAMLGNPKVGGIFDTMVAEWLLYPDQKKLSLKYLGEKYFEEKNPTYKELLNQYKPKGTKLKDATLEDVPREIVIKYAKKDVELTSKLYSILKFKLKETGLYDLFVGLEMPFLKVLMKMEQNGVKVDVEALKKLSDKSKTTIIELRKQIIKLAGEDFNVDSPKQMSKILYEKLLLPKLSQNTQYSTNERILKRIIDKHPIIPTILEYRKLTKLERTYLNALPKYVADDGRIHPSFRQVGTGTGRISCDTPNLQNIPKSGEIGDEMRKAFIPEEGNVFIIGDYDQMELRMLAHVSNDIEMIEAFRSGQDIHKLTAQQILGKAEVTDEERSRAKTVNFGIIYGQTASGLAKALGTDYITARSFIYKYACHFSEAWTWRKMAMSAAEKKPVIKTIIGRKRDLNATTGMVDRMALNTPIQGSCADLVKIAMLRCTKKLSQIKSKAKLILQIHDELVFEVPEEEAETLVPILTGVMESVNILNNITLKCPMKVDLKICRNWGEK